MTTQQIKKPTQYTLKGIKLGRFDDDLDKLLRAVQRRRADIGAIKVIKINTNGTPTITASSDEGATSETYAPKFEWPYNQARLDPEMAMALDRAHNGSSERAVPSLNAYNYNPGNAVNVGDYYFRKSDLTGRIIALTDDAAADTGVAILYVDSIARRNLTCYPLALSRLATNRKRHSAENKALSGHTLNISPDDVADMWDGGDHVTTFTSSGSVGVNRS